MTRVLIAGGTGFIGQHLTLHWLEKDYHITVLGRDKHRIERQFHNKVTALDWNEFSLRQQSILENIDYVINLCGKNLADKRWNNQIKQQLLDSRIKPTNILSQAITQMQSRKPTLLNASGIGIYGLQPDCDGLVFTENNLTSAQSTSFIVQLAKQWEAATYSARTSGGRVIILRFGVVLGPGGVLKKLLPSYKIGLGGKIGGGRQPFSWISLYDLIRIFDFIIANKHISGAINCISSTVPNQAQFAKTLADTLHRPHIIRTPAAMIRMLFGQMGNELLLHGQNALPAVLQSEQFNFEHNLKQSCQWAYQQMDIYS